MTNDAIDHSGEGSAAERRLRDARGQGLVARCHAAIISTVRPVRTPSVPVPGGSDSSGTAGRSFRGYGADHTQAPCGNSTSSAGIREKEWADNRRDRDTRVGRVSECSEKAWLSRAQDMASFKFTLTMRLIACATRSWPRPTVFWCRFGSVRSAAL